jgi:Leucine-rich repeat (LRR) protein
MLVILTKLKHLDLSGCSSVTGAGLKALHGCPNMRYLNLYYIGKFTDHDIEGVARNCQKLETFCLGGHPKISISHVAIHHLTRNCTNLTTLNLSAAIQEAYVSESISYIRKRCTFLKKLYLRDTKLKDTHIRGISEGNRALQLLDVSNCTMLSDSIFANRLMMLINILECMYVKHKPLNPFSPYFHYNR